MCDINQWLEDGAETDRNELCTIHNAQAGTGTMYCTCVMMYNSRWDIVNSARFYEIFTYDIWHCLEKVYALFLVRIRWG